MNNSKIFTMRDAYQKGGRGKYVVSRLFNRPSVNIVYSERSTMSASSTISTPGSAKSMLLMDLSACVVKGIPWLTNSDGLGTKATTSTGVLWVDCDNDVERTHERVKAIGTHYGLQHEDSFYYTSMHAGGLDMEDPMSMRDLEHLILPDVGMVIIDNLSGVIGNSDENSHEVAGVMSSFRMLAERHDLAVVIIPAGDWLPNDPFIEATIDCALFVERDEGTNRIIIRSSETRGAVFTSFGACFRSEGDKTIMKQGWFDSMDIAEIESMRDMESDLCMYLNSISDDDPSVLVYKDGMLDIIPVADYVVTERKELQKNLSYKTEWVPIGYGSYGEMQKCKDEIGRDGLGAIDTLLLDRI